MRFRSKYNHNVKSHILRKHTNPSHTQFYKCKHCNYGTIYSSASKVHILRKHTNSFEVQLCKCKFCEYKSSLWCFEDSYFKNTLILLKCKQCDYETKYGNTNSQM